MKTLAWLIVLGVGGYFLAPHVGIDLPSLTELRERVAPSPQEPVPVEPAAVSEAAVWEYLARWVESRPDRVADTDRVLSIAAELKVMGGLTDLSRLDSFKAKRVPIDDSNRAQIAAKVRGQ